MYFAIEAYCLLKPGQFINFFIFLDIEGTFSMFFLATLLFGSTVFLLGGGGGKPAKPWWRAATELSKLNSIFRNNFNILVHKYITVQLYMLVVIRRHSTTRKVEILFTVQICTSVNRSNVLALYSFYPPEPKYFTQNKTQRS